MGVPGSPRGAAGGLLSYFTRHGTAANLVMVLMLVLGLFAATKLRSQFFPDVVIERIVVTVHWDGAGPDDVDNGIVQLLEPPLLAVDGVDTVKSSSYEGRAVIRMEFEPGWDMARATDDVKIAVEGVSDLPEDADTPTVTRAAWRDRVTDVVISGPVSTDQLGRFADEFVSLLFRDGITRTTIRGLSAPETLVEVRQQAMVRHDISLRQVADAIRGEAEADPVGAVTGSASRVRTGVARRTVDALGDVVVRSNPDGSKLRVRDIAAISRQGVTRKRSFFVGDDAAISIRVDRSSQGDAISMQKQVAEVAAELESTLPAGVTVRLIRTRAEAISARLNILLDNGMIGLVLVLALLFLFLNTRTAIWVAAGIPVSVAATLALMYVSGLTINMVSLFALIITLGMIVDDAIVVGEHADFRARRYGEAPAVAAERAAQRMAAPVVSAALTTIIAFFALIVIGGRFGDLIADIPFTVVAVLTASLAECFLILPHHMSRALASVGRRHWYDWPSHLFNIAFKWFRARLFRPAVGWILKLRYPALALAVLALASQASLFIDGTVQWRFFNAPERGSITANFAMAPAADREDTVAMLKELQRAARDLGRQYGERYGTDPTEFVMGQVGGTSGRGLSGEATKEKDLLGALSIELIDADLRPYSSFQFLGDLQDSVRRHPLLETLSFRGWRSGPGGDAIDVRLSGAAATDLKAAAEMLKAELAKFPEVSSLEDDLAYDKREMVVELTPLGRALGFMTDGISRVLRQRLNGITAASYPEGVRTADITVKLPDSAMTADFLDRTMMRSPRGAYVPLGEIATFSSRAGFAAVRRENGLRVLTVTGDISQDDAERAALVERELRQRILPAIARAYGVSWDVGGLKKQENEFLSDAFFGFILALLGIYLILAWIFASWTRPLVVMAVIPFGLVGTIYGHDAWHIPLSMFSAVGLIGMTGVIINDSIVLVSTVDEYARDRDFRSAILDAVSDRLRPVLLTSLTTVMGLAPLLFETSRQAQFLKPTVVTLCYGLGFGMFLVLLVVPALLAAQRDIRLRMKALSRLARGRRAGWVQRLVLAGAGAAICGAFTVTFGEVAVTGALPGRLVEVLPLVAKLPSGIGAFVVFAAVAAAVSALAMLSAVIALGVARHGRGG